MHRFLSILVPLLLLGSSLGFSQDEIIFTKRAQSGEFGTALEIAVGSDGTIFAAYGSGGIRAYRFDGQELHRVAVFDTWENGGWQAEAHLAVGPDGTVFLANGQFGLSAFRFDGQSFTLLSTVPMDAARHVAVGPDGTVYATDYARRLLCAYQFNGRELVEIASVGTQAPPRALAVGPEGVIYLARGENPGRNDPGFCVFRYTGNSIVKEDSVAIDGIVDIATAPGDRIFLSRSTDGITVLHHDAAELVTIAQTNIPSESISLLSLPGGEVLTAIGWRGIGLYRFDGIAFDSVTAMDYDETLYLSDVVISDQGTIITADLEDGLAIHLKLEDRMETLTRVRDAGNVYDVTVAEDGTIFTASGGAGLRAYTLEYEDLREIAWVDHGWSVESVGLGLDSVVFTISGGRLYASIFDGQTLRVAASTNESATILVIGPHQYIFTSDGTWLRVYSFDGIEFHSLAEAAQPEIQAIGVRSDGMIFVTSRRSTGKPPALPPMLHVYRFEAGVLRKITETELRNSALHISFYNDETAILDRESYNLVNDSLVEAGIRAPGGSLCWITSQTVFQSAYAEGLAAFRIDSATFHTIGGIPGILVLESAVHPSNTVLLARGYEGLAAYSYASVLSIAGEALTERESILLASHPNPFIDAASITFRLREDNHVRLAVHDAMGREVALVTDADYSRGEHSVMVRSGQLPSGLYFCRLTTERGVVQRKMVLMR
ncbi:MAG: T9SS type A sorting domain-containing protein [Bacteroidetes bacterium]|nr:T9SS type A sorting domain-containing protein [Bacteroidota bacterium]